MPTDHIKQCLANSFELTNWLDDQVGAFELPSSKRLQFCLACLEVARQHHRAIIRLIQHDLSGSAAALLRSLFESYARAVWLERCANDNELESFIDDKEVKIGRVIEQIELLPDFDSGVLHEIKSDWWRTMCSFTHAGIQAVGRNINGSNIEPSFSEGEIEHSLRFANGLALLVAFQLASIAGLESAKANLLRRAGAIGSKPGA